MSVSSEFRNPFDQVRPSPPVPVLVLADVSGSMSRDGKIQVLNNSIRAMIRDFAAEESPNGEIMVGVITFGDDKAELHQPLVPAATLRWSDLTPGGNTPLGKALDRARELLEDETVIPERASTPTLIVVSDGIPTDKWQDSFERLMASPRAARAVRLAVAVGPEVGTPSYDVLTVIADHVVKVDEIDRLRQFFRWVTRSITTYVRSATLDRAPTFDPDELYDLTD